METAMSADVIKVFIGCDPNNCDLEQMMVLDYSIRKHTSRPVEIVWMQISRNPESYWYSNPERDEGWHTQEWATPFSGFRWSIPEYCGFEGRAIYMDADVVVLSDLADLWQHPIEGEAIVAAKGGQGIRRLCVSVWDCAKAQKHLPPVAEQRANPHTHKTLMDSLRKNPQWVHPFNDSYNCVDGEGLPIEDIRILHYSDMGTQFSHKHSLPRLAAQGQKHWFDGQLLEHPRKDLTELFDRYYQEALDAGYRLENYVVTPFGPFPKKSQANYTGNDVTRERKQKSALSRAWKGIKDGLRGH